MYSVGIPFVVQRWLSGNRTYIHEDVGLIPGPPQWVKDLMYLWLWCRPAAAAPIQPPSLGTSICHKRGPKKKKKIIQCCFVCVLLIIFVCCYYFSFILFYLFVCLFFVCVRGMQKFPGQGSNLHCSSDPSHSSDNARFLTH